MNAAVQRIDPDRRAHTREPQMRQAVVMHGESGRGYPCVVVNGSAGGALLQVSDALPAGDLTLIDSQAGALHELRVVWRRGPFVGIAYTATTQLP